jgi:hypothetical protein
LNIEKVKPKMPIVVAQQIRKLYVHVNFSALLEQYLFLVNVEEITNKYRHVCTGETKVYVFLSRVFNQEYEVTNEPRIFCTLRLINALPYGGDVKRLYSGYHQAEGYHLDLDDLADELSIPDGYFVETLLISFINKSGERVIFPNEMRIQTIKELEATVKERIEALRKIGSISQSHSFLADLGLKDIADDLSQGYSRFEIGDYDSAIKSYRKVVEGFRNYFAEKEEKEGKKVFKKLIDNSETRTEKIVDFLNKTYSLLSNFGEHYGTHAFEEEGVFANKIVEDLTEYLTKKLRKK